MLNISDTIIDVRSNRVRSLLGLQSEENETNQNLANGAETTRRVPDNRRLRWEPGSKTGPNLAEEMLMNTEESVMANFDFLSRENDLDDEDEVMADETDDGFSPSQIVKKADLGGLGVDTDTEDVLKEFNFLTQTEVFFCYVDRGGGVSAPCCRPRWGRRASGAGESGWRAGREAPLPLWSRPTWSSGSWSSSPSTMITTSTMIRSTTGLPFLGIMFIILLLL